jgi:hypothetical protein
MDSFTPANENSILRHGINIQKQSVTRPLMGIWVLLRLIPAIVPHKSQVATM